ncbi:MAG: penicillin acylase family protein [Acidobacteria bacterium]|nr:penicillin acylase family protein [Acidobacteriota bacterium]
MLKRILRLLLAGVGLTLAAGLIFFYWAAIRPLAVTSGTVPGPPATAGRDRLGVPHIEARTIEDALWVQGWVTAQDRLWQMDLLRRLAAGELSEVLGPAMIAVDRDMRTLGMHRAAKAAAGRFGSSDRAYLEAYIRGVNAFLDAHRGNLPVEFHLLRYQPRAWELSDSVLVAMNMFRTLSTTWKDELMKRSLLERASAQQVQALLPVRSGHEMQPGSNAWVVSGAHTASGKPLFANDPHLEYSIPSIWYTVHLKAPGLNVIGASVPGLPAVIVGHNDHIAWGPTNLHFDVQDLYLHPAPERTEQEIIHVKGAREVVAPVGLTRHGPIVAEVGDQKASLRWTAADPSVWEYPFVELDRARDWQEFRAALSRYGGPAQNWVYADVAGNIGYQAAGKLPIRKGYDGSVPVPGDGRFEWQGYIPFEQLPRIYNPPSGIIVTANQNPFPPDYPYTVSGNFASHYRSNRIRELLEKGSRFEPQDFLRIQTDLYSPFGHSFAAALLEAIDRRKPTNPDLIAAAPLLRNWDGQFRAEHMAPVLVSLTYGRFLRHLVEGVAGEKAALYTSQMSTAFVEQVLATRPAGWTSDYDELLLKCLSQAMREWSQTPDIRTWGQYLETTLAHPVGHRIPILRRWFDIGPFPQSGTTTTIKQTTKRLAPSMRLIVDLADLDQSLHNITTGESGQPFSPHYKDQWPAYYEGRSFPLLYSSPEIVERLVFQP